MNEITKKNELQMNVLQLHEKCQSNEALRLLEDELTAKETSLAAQVLLLFH